VGFREAGVESYGGLHLVHSQVALFLFAMDEREKEMSRRKLRVVFNSFLRRRSGKIVLPEVVETFSQGEMQLLRIHTSTFGGLQFSNCILIEARVP